MSYSFKDAILSPLALTANGMPTLETSSNPLVDLFFIIGSSRGKDITDMVEKAYQYNPDLTMKMIFWVRDVREGAGERSTFRNIINYLEYSHPDSLMKNIQYIPYFGRWDDILSFKTPLFQDAGYNLLALALLDNNALAAKWAKRKGPIANAVRKKLGYTPKQYRQLIVSLTDVVEQKMCSNNWSSINYSHVPSVAAGMYQKAFMKRDKERYTEYKEKLKSGDKSVKINASAVYPYNVIKSMQIGDVDVSIAQWNSLPNYMGDSKILPMVDVSGSMSQTIPNMNITCMDVAVSLGLYVADKQTGPFKDCFLTFSANSKLQVLEGDINQKYRSLTRAEWGMNTSLESGFQQILKLALSHRISQEDMPKIVLVLSDMEFDAASNKNDTAYQMMAKMYEQNGYQLPKVVWWNLNARIGNNPVKYNQDGTALVSGFSPSLMKSILKVENFDPISIVKETVENERYANIKA